MLTQYTYSCHTCGKQFTSPRRKCKFCSQHCFGVYNRPHNTADDFWGHVDKSGGDSSCWEWLQARDKSGYGVYRWDNKTIRANRLAWKLTNGAIPQGMLICHRCDNPPCCNPTHLFIGTALDNTRDTIRKGRFCYGNNKGERHSMAKLTSAKAVEIRMRYYGLNETAREIGLRFNVNQNTIYSVVHGRTWVGR